MANLIRSKKFTGVYYRKKKDGDKVYYFTYKDNNHISKTVKVGLLSNGISEQYTFDQRSETISALKSNKVPSLIREKKRLTIVNSPLHYTYKYSK